MSVFVVESTGRAVAFGEGLKNVQVDDETVSVVELPDVPYPPDCQHEWTGTEWTPISDGGSA